MTLPSSPAEARVSPVEGSCVRDLGMHGIGDAERERQAYFLGTIEPHSQLGCVSEGSRDTRLCDPLHLPRLATARIG